MKYIVGGVTDPSGIIVADAILAAIARKVSSQTSAFDVIKSIAGSIFLLQDKVFRGSLADGCKGWILFQHGNGIDAGTIVSSAPTDIQVTAIFLV